MILQVSTATKLYLLKKTNSYYEWIFPKRNESRTLQRHSMARLRKGKQALMYVTRAWPQIFPPAVPARVHLTL